MKKLERFKVLLVDDPKPATRDPHVKVVGILILINVIFECDFRVLISTLSSLLGHSIFDAWNLTC